MVSWQSIQSFLLFFGPLLLPRILAYYRSVTQRPSPPSSSSSSQSQRQTRRTPTRQTSRALAVLFTSALLAFLSTLPIFAPENIFRATHSRLQTPAGVLLTRLAALRPLKPQDSRLRAVLDAGGLDARLLYARLGPEVVRGCEFATPGDVDAGWAYLLYAAPGLVGPHVVHGVVLGVATSGTLGGVEGARWRSVACVAALALAAVELWVVVNYDDRANARSTRVAEVDFFYWKCRVWRGLAVAAFDAALGWFIWLQATGRAFLAPASPGERVVECGRVLEGALVKARGLGVVRNGGVRSAALRKRADEYWVREGEVMKDVFEEPEVLEAQRDALRRLDIARISKEAETHLDTMVLGSLRLEGGGQNG